MKYAYGVNGHNFDSEIFDSVEEALEEAKRDYPDEDYVFIGEAEPYVSHIRTETILDDLVEAAADDGFDDYTDDYLTGLTGAQISELDAALNDAFKKWEEKHNLQPSFYSVENTKRYSLRRGQYHA